MDLSGLKSADHIDMKDVIAHSFRIVWDQLGWFPLQIVPVLFPPTNSTDFTRVGRTALDYTRFYVATTFDRWLSGTLGRYPETVWSRFNVADSNTPFR